jgi:hypothetical protein
VAPFIIALEAHSEDTSHPIVETFLSETLFSDIFLLTVSPNSN